MKPEASRSKSTKGAEWREAACSSTIACASELMVKIVNARRHMVKRPEQSGCSGVSADNASGIQLTLLLVEQM